MGAGAIACRATGVVGDPASGDLTAAIPCTAGVVGIGAGAVSCGGGAVTCGT